MSFATDLWDGLEKVSEHIELQVKVGKDLADLLEKRAKYEEDYAKHLADLGKQLPGGKTPAAARTETTLRAAIEEVVRETAALAEPHNTLASVLVTQIAKPYGVFLKGRDAERKKQLKEGEKKLKTLRDLENTARKAYEHYEKATQDAQKACEAEKRARAELMENAGVRKYEAAVPKAAATKKRALDRMQQMEQVARTALDNVNVYMRKVYDEEMPQVLSELQKVSEDIFNQTAEYLALYAEKHKDFEGPYAKAHEQLTLKLKDELDKTKDLNEFIASAKSEKDKYELKVFEKLPNPAEEEDKEDDAPHAAAEEEKPQAAPVVAAAAAAAVVQEEEKKEEEKTEEPEKAEEEKKDDEEKKEEKAEEPEKKEEEKAEEPKEEEPEKKEEEKAEEPEKTEEEKKEEEPERAEEKKEEPEKKEEEKTEEPEKKEEEKKEEKAEEPEKAEEKKEELEKEEEKKEEEKTEEPEKKEEEKTEEPEKTEESNDA